MPNAAHTPTDAQHLNPRETMNTNQNTGITAAFALLERLAAHPDMFECHYGLICEHGKWSAVCLVGDDEPLTALSEWSELRATPMAAVKLAMKDTAKELMDIIRCPDTGPAQRRDCRELRRALLVCR